MSVGKWMGVGGIRAAASAKSVEGAGRPKVIGGLATQRLRMRAGEGTEERAAVSQLTDARQPVSPVAVAVAVVSA